MIFGIMLRRKHRQTRALLIPWAALRWLALMFVVAPAVEAPLVAHPSEPAKPLMVWTGTASWYGPGFHGRETANGEIFDCEALTAAHPTLPFDSLVRVVNAQTGRYQVVRINDRGPYQEDREIDVSLRTARNLGMIHHGIARVRLELLALPDPR